MKCNHCNINFEYQVLSRYEGYPQAQDYCSWDCLIRSWGPEPDDPEKQFIINLYQENMRLRGTTHFLKKKIAQNPYKNSRGDLIRRVKNRAVDWKLQADKEEDKIYQLMYSSREAEAKDILRLLDEPSA